MNELARRYAEALYDLAPDEEALRATAQAMMADAALWESLRSPAVQAWEKERILDRLPILDGHGPLLGFYRLLAEKGRMALLPEILEAFGDMALARRGAARCRLCCVRVPGEEEQEKLRQALCRLHHKQDVVFDVCIDPSLLGGLKVRVGSRLFDASLRSKLDSLKFALKRA